MSCTKYEGERRLQKRAGWGPVLDIVIIPMSHVTLNIIFLFDFLRKVCQNPPHFIFKNSVNGLLWLLTCFFLIHEVKKVLLEIPNIKAFDFLHAYLIRKHLICKFAVKTEKKEQLH